MNIAGSQQHTYLPYTSEDEFSDLLTTSYHDQNNHQLEATELLTVMNKGHESASVTEMTHLPSFNELVVVASKCVQHTANCDVTGPPHKTQK